LVRYDSSHFEPVLDAPKVEELFEALNSLSAAVFERVKHLRDTETDDVESIHREKCKIQVRVTEARETRKSVPLVELDDEPEANLEGLAHAALRKKRKDYTTPMAKRVNPNALRHSVSERLRRKKIRRLGFKRGKRKRPMLTISFY